MIRILYGGTFDPVHEGHLAVAEAAAAQFDADVALLPSADPPHRPPPGATARERAEMLDLAVAGRARLRVDRRELDRSGPSYSVETLLEVRSEVGPDAALAWLLGADAFRDLHHWHRWREMAGLAHLIVAVRPGHALDGFDPVLQAEVGARWAVDPVALVSSPCGLLFKLDLPPRPEAASRLRERIAFGQRWDDQTPPAVASYIRAHGLYTGNETSPPQG